MPFPEKGTPPQTQYPHKHTNCKSVSLRLLFRAEAEEADLSAAEAALREKHSAQERALVMARMARAMSRMHVKRRGK